MRKRTILVTGKDAFIGSVLIDMVEKEHLGTLCPYCSHGPETLQCIFQMHPQFIVLDLFLPGLNGLSLLGEIKKCNYNPQILAYCRRLNKMVGVKAVKAGATGLIDYSSTREEFRQCLERVARGIRSYPAEVKSLLEDNDYEKFPQKYTKVTTRQAQVLEMVARGMSNMEISYALGIHVKTVEKHKLVLKRKFGLFSMAEVIHFAIRNGIIEREEGLCS